MAGQSYLAKTLVTVSVLFSVAGVPTAPTTVTLRVQWPDGTITSPTPTNTGTGAYSENLDTTSYPAGGEVQIEWEGTGTCQAVATDSFQILALPF